MEFFPSGIHLRLRASAGEYLHADKQTKDGLCVSLRGNWSRGLPNTEWVVHHHQREGTTHLLLRSAANGGYLSAKFKRNRRGHGHRFVHLRLWEAPEAVDAFSLWEVFRAPGRGDIVILRHASGSFLSEVNGWWPRVAAVDFHHGQNPTMQMRWVVAEVIPPKLGPQVLSGSTKEIALCALNNKSCCKSCGKATSAGQPFCISCADEPTNLLAASKREMSVPNSYCLVCHKLVGEEHAHHDDNTILIDCHEKGPAAFVTGREPWADLFLGIQSGWFGYIHLIKPVGDRCAVCNDLVQLYGQGLYEDLYHFCTLKCFVEKHGGTAEVHLTEKILGINFESNTNAFCLFFSRRNMYSS